MRRLPTRKLFILLAVILLSSVRFTQAAITPDDSSNHHPLIRWTAPGDRWLAVDKYRHLTASALLMGLSYNLARCEGRQKRHPAIVIGCSFSLSLGIAKEAWDAHRAGNYASLKDLAADIIGIGLGILCMTDWLKF